MILAVQVMKCHSAGGAYVATPFVAMYVPVVGLSPPRYYVGAALETTQRGAK